MSLAGGGMIFYRGGLFCVGIARAWVCRQDGRKTEARKSWALRPKSSERTVYWRPFGKFIGAMLSCHTVRELRGFNFFRFYSLGRDSVLGVRLWLSCLETQQKRWKLPSKMWVDSFAIVLFVFNGPSSSSSESNLILFQMRIPVK